ncbi:ankyrin repeat domain-containing protein [bacterium]|nr:ankyrin repeat domain-containing protein [bacterium]MBU1636433.1 ankyrin repeat domain-containing protein [bacterium]
MVKHLQTTPLETGSADGSTPLIAAIVADCSDCVKALLKRGAALDYHPSHVQPLHLACDTAGVAIVTLLLRQDLDINAIDRFGLSPLGHAILHRRPATARVLLDRGADPNSIWTYDSPLLALAAQFDSTCFELLLKSGADLTLAHRSEWPPLHAAAANGQLGLIQRLLDLGIAIDLARPNGSTPLAEAALQGQTAAVQFLLDHGADPTVRVGGYSIAELASRLHPGTALLVDAATHR